MSDVSWMQFPVTGFHCDPVSTAITLLALSLQMAGTGGDTRDTSTGEGTDAPAMSEAKSQWKPR